VKDIDHPGKANGVDGPVGIAVFIIDHLQHASAAKTLQRLGARMLLAVLRIVDRKTHDAANLVPGKPAGRLETIRSIQWASVQPFASAYSSTAIEPSTDCRRHANKYLQMAAATEDTIITKAMRCAAQGTLTNMQSC